MTSGGPRKGSGRKPKPKKLRRTIAVQVRLTLKQKKWLDAYASAIKMRPGELLFLWLIDYIPF